MVSSWQEIDAGIRQPALSRGRGRWRKGAAAPALPPEGIDSLSRSDYSFTRAAVAGNPALTQEQFVRLGNDTELEVVMRLVANDAAPDYLVIDLFIHHRLLAGTGGGMTLAPAHRQVHAAICRSAIHRGPGHFRTTPTPVPRALRRRSWTSLMDEFGGRPRPYTLSDPSGKWAR
jgi:hypothetical protein